MMKFAITVVSPPGYPHSQAFTDIAETLHHGLMSLGHDSVMTRGGNLQDRQHIVLGANLLPAYPLPLSRSAILYNLEQVETRSPWMTPALLALFRRHRVWDYSARNVETLNAWGIRVDHVLPVGYVEQLTRFAPAAEQDIDVLFVGSMNERRAAALRDIQAAGLRAEAVFGVYGKDRDRLIARAKLLLNVHFYEAKVLETVRLSYLLANSCAVLSESSLYPDEDREFATGVAFSSYEGLARRARELIDDPGALARLRLEGRQLMQRRPATVYLRQAIDTLRAPASVAH